MGYEYTLNALIRDFYTFQTFLFNNGFTGINYINSSDGTITINYNSELDQTQIDTLSNLVLNVYTNPYPSNNEDSLISTCNSTSELLNSVEWFNGAFEDVCNYSTISIFASADASSNINGIFLDYSSDGIKVDYTQSYELLAGIPFIECVTVFLKYFKIRYNNGTVPQTSFTLQTMYYKNRSKNIADTTNISKVVISEEAKNANTGGHFRIQGMQETIPANTIGTFDYTWKFNISPLVIKFNTSPSQKGDTIDMVIAPETIIGVLTQSTTGGETVIRVSNSVLQHIAVGHLITITNGLNTNVLGDVLAVNLSASTLTVETPVTNSFTAGATYVKFGVYTIKNFIINNAGTYDIGNSKTGASYVPSGIKVRLIYSNNSDTDINFIWAFEFLY